MSAIRTIGLTHSLIGGREIIRCRVFRVMATAFAALTTTKRIWFGGLAFLAAVTGAGTPAMAQQTTGTPGSPGATTTIDGRYLPAPPQKFEGDINVNAAQSKPYWPARTVPPKGAPNVLLIMTDDVGFAAPSTFGGVIPTPTLDRVAAMGLRYTAFHTTALCSPTRAITRWAPASWSIKRPVIPVTTALFHETRSPLAKF